MGAASRGSEGARQRGSAGARERGCERARARESERARERERERERERQRARETSTMLEAVVTVLSDKIALPKDSNFRSVASLLLRVQYVTEHVR